MLIISIGGIVSGNIAGVVAGAIGIVLTLGAVAVTVTAMRRPPARERVTRAVIWTLGRVQRLIRRPTGTRLGSSPPPWPVYWRLRREQPQLAVAVTAAGAAGPVRGADHGHDDQPPDPAQPSPQEPSPQEPNLG